MSDIAWYSGDDILVASAQRTLGSVLQRMDDANPVWVVVVRTRMESSETYYYALSSNELRELANQFPERITWSIERAMDMHEWMSSRTARGGRPIGPVHGQNGPAATRIVNFDAEGRIVGIGEWGVPDLVPGDGDKDVAYREVAMPGTYDLGPMRGGHWDGEGQFTVAVGGAAGPQASSDAAADINVTLSAETKAEVQVGNNELIDFRMELTAEAAPLAVRQAAQARPDVPIVVSLSVDNDTIEVLKDREHTVDPPAPKQPRVGFFLVRGARSGVARLAVTFRQGGSELGVIGLAIEVVDALARSDVARGAATAAPRDLADDDKLALLVEQRTEGGAVFYEYILHSEALGLPYRRLRSKPLLDRGGGTAATTQAFVERIYEHVTKELRSLDDLKQLQREARALGANLCRELFDPEVAKVLWPLRDRIKLVQIVSWEPYIPWELVRLRDPDSGDIDDRFLAEYGLVRTLSDDMPPRVLPMARWGYLGATFRQVPFPPVGAELDYFTSTSPESLQGHGITPSAISTTRDAFYDALAKDEFDVLHISCHAESPHESIERANLIIGDETPPGSTEPRLVEVDTITVAAEANLKKRRPLVFLNACETGRMGAVLTAWGGWPNVFLRAGAGAFVGSSWAVRDKPAAVFSTTFYDAMLNGQTLAEAASAARAAAKALGDASWLAFKVYGHPRARRQVA